MYVVSLVICLLRWFVSVSSGTKVRKQLGQLDQDKLDGGEDIFVDMPPLKDGSNHDKDRICQTPLQIMTRF